MGVIQSSLISRLGLCKNLELSGCNNGAYALRFCQLEFKYTSGIVRTIPMLASHILQVRKNIEPRQSIGLVQCSFCLLTVGYPLGDCVYSSQCYIVFPVRICFLILCLFYLACLPAQSTALFSSKLCLGILTVYFQVH